MLVDEQWVREHLSEPAEFWERLDHVELNDAITQLGLLNQDIEAEIAERRPLASASFDEVDAYEQWRVQALRERRQVNRATRLAKNALARMTKDYGKLRDAVKAHRRAILAADTEPEPWDLDLYTAAQLDPVDVDA